METSYTLRLHARTTPLYIMNGEYFIANMCREFSRMNDLYKHVNNRDFDKIF